MNNFCTACGERLPADSKFCPACGAQIDAATAPAATPPRRGRRKVWLVTGLATAGVLLVVILLASAPDKKPPPSTATTGAPTTGAATVAQAPPTPAQPAAITAKRWEHYVNTRYGVSLDYPADLFAIQPPPFNNAGRSFEAKALKARFFVHSNANALGASLDELQAEDVLDIGDAGATQRKGKDWYQVVGRRNGDPNGEHVIRQVLLSEEGSMVHRLEIVVPAALSKAFEPIATRIVRSLRVDPSIPEKAATNAGAQPTPAATRHWQTIDSLGLGLRANGARKTAGVSLQIPAAWQRVALPEPYLLEYAASASEGGTKFRLLIEALRVPAHVPLAREAEAIKSTIKPGVDYYREQNEGEGKVAQRPARRLTLIFKAMDEPYLQRQEYLLLRAGGTVFKILVQGPDAQAAALDTVFGHAVATLAVAE